jgi:hypothetical protein
MPVIVKSDFGEEKKDEKKKILGRTEQRRKGRGQRGAHT